jgi:hypothetical protein
LQDTPELELLKQHEAINLAFGSRGDSVVARDGGSCAARRLCRLGKDHFGFKNKDVVVDCMALAAIPSPSNGQTTNSGRQSKARIA